jgi:hypothetical protein
MYSMYIIPLRNRDYGDPLNPQPSTTSEKTKCFSRKRNLAIHHGQHSDD